MKVTMMKVTMKNRILKKKKTKKRRRRRRRRRMLMKIFDKLWKKHSVMQ
jgi:hypothetical protein